MTPEIAFQTALRLRLTDTPSVTDLVPAASILDRNERPAPDPAIIIGEGQSVDDGNSLSRTLTRVYMDIHIWKREPSTEGVKAIAGTIRATLRDRLDLGANFHAADCAVSSARYLRDPDGETSHAIVTVAGIVQEIV